MSERIVLILATILISFTLGMVVGIVNIKSISSHVAVTGTIGEWFAGVATFMAVAFALWQSYEHRHKERMRVRILYNESFEKWSFRVVSEGLIPITVVGVDICIGDVGNELNLAERRKSGLNFPSKLERGEVLQVISLESHQFSEFSDWLISPFIKSLSSRSISPGGIRNRINELYFQELDLLSKSRLKITVHLAHESVVHVVSKELVGKLVSDLSDRHRRDQLEKLRYEDASDEEFFNLAKGHFPPGS